MDTLVSVLYHITTALLAPVIWALLLLLAWALFQAGGFVREWLARRRTMRRWRQFLSQLSPDAGDPAATRQAFFGRTDYPGVVGVFAEQGQSRQDDVVTLDRLVSEIEIEVAEKTSRMNLWIRLGPTLGLMGTLIPMGPALIGLSRGEVETMASNLVVAFSTTVIGLLVGAIFSLMSVSRRHWYVRDLADIEHVLAMMFPEEQAL